MAKQKYEMASMDDWLSSAGGGGKSIIKVPSGVSRWEPKKPGEYLVDAVPYRSKTNPFAKKPGQLVWVRKYYMHWGIGPNKEPVFCNAGNFGKKCAVCEYIADLYADPEQSEENKKIAKSIKKKERELWNKFVHAEKEKGVQVFDISSYCYGDNLSAKINMAPDEETRKKRRNFALPDGGYTLNAGAVEDTAGGGQKFLNFTSFEFRKRKEPLADSLLEKAVCLDDLIKLEDYKAVKAKLHGDIGDDDPDDGEDSELEEPSDVEEPSDISDLNQIAVGDEVEFTYKKKVRRGVVKKIKDGENGEIAYVTVDYQEKPAVVNLSELSLVEPDDDDEDSDDDDDDFVTQKKPSRNGKRQAAVDEDDDDEPDEDSDLEDEEDDDPPASRPKRRAKR